MFDWPGNIAQLVNYVEKTVILNQSVTKDLILDVDSLALDMGDYNNEEIASNNHDLSLKEARINVESSLKDQVLRTYFSKKVNSHYVSVKKSRIMPQHSTYLARTSTENSKKSKSMTSWKSST